jgi:hypothetical protein
MASRIKVRPHVIAIAAVIASATLLIAVSGNLLSLGIPFRG